MTSTQELIGMHNDAARKSWSKYTTDIKVEKLIITNATQNVNVKTILDLQILVIKSISIPC